MALTDKQRRFVDEYLIDLNATQAAVRAGYSENTARSIGSENFGKPAVAEAIAEAQRERAERTGVTADQVVRELARVAFSDLRKVVTGNGHLIDPKDWDDDTAAAIAAVEVVTSSRGEKDTAGRRSNTLTRSRSGTRSAPSKNSAGIWGCSSIAMSIPARMAARWCRY